MGGDHHGAAQGVQLFERQAYCHFSGDIPLRAKELGEGNQEEQAET
jgi:hypothetical protein